MLFQKKEQKMVRKTHPRLTGLADVLLSVVAAFFHRLVLEPTQRGLAEVGEALNCSLEFARNASVFATGCAPEFHLFLGLPTRIPEG